MCGIAGVIARDPSAPPEGEAVRGMVAALGHRGPDGTGFWEGPGAALGHARLSIIDLEGGAQPMGGEDGGVRVVFNGEIYNFGELRLDLSRRGHVFRTRSDTEAIVHGFEAHGADVVQDLRGMFAFAAWDVRARRLVLARDRLGKKPLYWHSDGERIAFASELPALLRAPGIPRRLRPAAVDDYLALQYVPHPGTILEGVSKLPPAHVLAWEEGRTTVSRYWSPGSAPPFPGRREEALRTLRALLSESVERRLIADVPLGAFLSGGIDSTIVTGLMARLSKGPVRTFSIGFEESDFDERAYARAAASAFRTDHKDFVVRPEAAEILPLLVRRYGEPFADSSAVPTWYLSKMTREHVTVALSGDGGDEAFCGYERYPAVRFAGAIDRAVPAVLRRALAALAPCAARLPLAAARRAHARRFLEGLPLAPEERYRRWISIWRDEERAALYAPGFAASLGGHDPAAFLREAWGRAPGAGAAGRTNALDVLTYLPCDILAKVDFASMANGLEVRCPFLDPAVVDFGLSLPLGWKLRGLGGKRILKEAFADLLPETIRGRGKKGFGVPVGAWFRGPLRGMARDLLLGARARARGLFDPAAVERTLSDHEAGRIEAGPRLWSLLWLEIWFREVLEAGP